MKEKLYHVSHVPNLTILEPKVSSHGKPYVYATKDLTVALMFGSYKSMGDLDGAYGGGCNGRKPYFYEAFPGAFKRRFEDTSCYIYEVDPRDFMENKTQYNAELVSEKPVKVLSCTKVDNLEQTLLDLDKQGKFELRFYEKDNPNYVQVINSFLKERIKRCGLLNDKEQYRYKFCTWYYPHIIDELEKELSIK